MLEPAIPQLSGIRREAGAVVRMGIGMLGEREQLSFSIQRGKSENWSVILLNDEIF